MQVFYAIHGHYSLLNVISLVGSSQQIPLFFPVNECTSHSPERPICKRTSYDFLFRRLYHIHKLFRLPFGF
jgi:hypothetical protein